MRPRSSGTHSKVRGARSAVNGRRSAGRVPAPCNLQYVSYKEPTMPNPPTIETLDARIAAAVQTVRQPRPKHARPIVVIGAGGIVRAAHLPAYEKAGFPVIGIMDQERARAAELASQRGIPRTFSSVAEAVRFAPPDPIFDVAVPAS